MYFFIDFLYGMVYLLRLILDPNLNFLFYQVIKIIYFKLTKNAYMLVLLLHNICGSRWSYNIRPNQHLQSETSRLHQQTKQLKKMKCIPRES